MRSSVPVIVGLAICLPCLIPVLLAIGVGAGTISAFGAWFTGNSFVLGAAAVTAVAFAVLAWVMYMRNAKGAACEVDPAENKLALSQRDRSAPNRERTAVTERNER